MRKLKMVIMAALLLTFFSGKVLADEFDFYKSLTDVGAKADNAISQTLTMVRSAFDFSSSYLGIEDYMNSHAVKAILPPTLFDSAKMGVGFADAVITGITGFNLAVMDFTKSELGTKLLAFKF